jgi:hypothetical protein
MNSNGLDEYIVDKCYSQAQQAPNYIPSTTLIANDPYLQLSINLRKQGKAFTQDRKDLER